MDNSLGSTIKKIKLQEQNKEAELKAKREFEAKKAAVERSIREAISQATKLQEEQCELLKKTDELRAQVTIQKIRRDALAGQLVASKKELNELEGKYDQARIQIQEQRSFYCTAVQKVSNQCDVWSLLMKPTATEPVSRPVKKVSENNGQEVLNEQGLMAAKEKREKAIAERERLLAEPEVGHEFVRIRNALRYSLEMTSNLRKQN
ncbi:uncharacterized protein LOC113239995 [Hyposmocoma kahamanoa]|uniref:uncharacterized protein LOC113239995 n=1 Tax=Hyposmocoma kahamanoa TaxID=1477025 RepID=UPI000E6D6D82|nr:uncharacterized protein LOC113239995 [Hyposmocoma kahamanoa]